MRPVVHILWPLVIIIIIIIITDPIRDTYVVAQQAVVEWRWSC